MLLDFAGMMINTNYIISIYKTKNYKNAFTINIEIYSYRNPIIESYNTVQEAKTRFDEIIEKINNSTGRNKDK